MAACCAFAEAGCNTASKGTFKYFSRSKALAEMRQVPQQK
jgi:hypothetical protein